MNAASGLTPPGISPSLPTSIWVVAWACLADQALLLVSQGGRLQDDAALLVSVVLGGLLVGYVSAGVVRARTVRTVLAWLVLVLSLIGGLVALLTVDDAGQAALAGLSLATTVVTLAALARFRRTDWYSWQRSKPSTDHGASIGGLVAIGVLVGALGGLIGPVDGGLEARLDVAGLPGPAPAG